MNTNMAGFRWFSKIFASLCLDESSLSIGSVVFLQTFANGEEATQAIAKLNNTEYNRHTLKVREWMERGGPHMADRNTGNDFKFNR